MSVVTLDAPLQAESSPVVGLDVNLASEAVSTLGTSGSSVAEVLGILMRSGTAGLEVLRASPPADVRLYVESQASCSLAEVGAAEDAVSIRLDAVGQTENGLAFLLVVDSGSRLESLLTSWSPRTVLYAEVLGRIVGDEHARVEVPFATVDGRRVITRLDLVLDVPQDVYVVGPEGPFVFTPPDGVSSTPGTLMPQSAIKWSGTGVASPGGFPEADVAKVWVQLNSNGQSWRFVPHNLGSGTAVAENEGVSSSLPYTVWPRSKLPLSFTQDVQEVEN